jgi:hypothetical protein
MSPIDAVSKIPRRLRHSQHFLHIIILSDYQIMINLSNGHAEGDPRDSRIDRWGPFSAAGCAKLLANIKAL